VANAARFSLAGWDAQDGQLQKGGRGRAAEAAG
jgi:hypothetical protein